MKTPQLILGIIALGSLLLGAGTLTAQAGAADDAGAVASQSVVSTEAGRAALAAAAERKRSAYDTSGEAREAGLLAAARAFEQVAEDPNHGPLDRVEAAFRAGEILRARGLMEDALERFEDVVQRGEGHVDGRVLEFAARALLEQAHAVRREGDVNDALAAYADVRKRFGDQRRQAAHACTWTVKLLVKAGRSEEASPHALDLEAFLPEYSLEAVRNVDLVAQSLLDEGRAAAALSAVSRLESGLAAGPESGETMAERVRGALEALRAKMPPSGYLPPQGG